MGSQKNTLTAWSLLAVGEEVWLYRDEVLLASGWIDETMPDGSAMWIDRHGCRGRALFLHEDVTATLRRREPRIPSH